MTSYSKPTRKRTPHAPARRDAGHCLVGVRRNVPLHLRQSARGNAARISGRALDRRPGLLDRHSPRRPPRGARSATTRDAGRPRSRARLSDDRRGRPHGLAARLRQRHSVERRAGGAVRRDGRHHARARGRGGLEGEPRKFPPDGRAVAGLHRRPRRRHLRLRQPGLRQLLGAKSEAEIVGRTALSFVDPDPIAMRRASGWSALGARESVAVRSRALPPHRRLARATSKSRALPLRYGNRNAVQVIARDITDRVRAEDELRARETRACSCWPPARTKRSGSGPGAKGALDQWRLPADGQSPRTIPTRSSKSGCRASIPRIASRTPGPCSHARDGNGGHLVARIPALQADGTYRVVLDRGHNVSGRRTESGA